MTSEQLSRCLGTNPVVVRRTMGFLRRAGIVASEKGQAGGWRISSDLSSITLRDLHTALEEPEIFAIGHRHEAPECLVEQAVNAALDAAIADAETLLLRRMGEVSLADLAADFAQRHAARREQNKDDRHDA